MDACLPLGRCHARRTCSRGSCRERAVASTYQPRSKEVSKAQRSQKWSNDAKTPSYFGGGVDVADDGRLTTEVGTGHSDAADGFVADVGLVLVGMGVVSHDGKVLAGGGNLLEETESVIGVVVGNKAVRPVGERLGADTDVLDMGERGVVEDGLDVAAELMSLHDHGITAGDEHISDL